MGADIRLPRIFKFILGWVTPVLMIGIFIVWTWQNALDQALMAGIDEPARPYALGARLFMLAVLVGLLYLIRKAWRGKSAAVGRAR